MKKDEYKIQDLKDYLLDRLPAEQVEQFDELSFTDEDFADQLNAAEKDLVDEYVRGDLSGATLEKFKSHYLASPLRREKVEFAKAFRVYSEQNAAKEIAVENTESKREVFFSFLDIFAMRPILQFGFAAAALAFVILGGLLIFKNRGSGANEMAKQNSPAPTISQESAQPNAQSPSAVPTVEREVAQANVKTNSSPENTKEQTNKSTNLEPPRVPKQTPTPPQISIATFILAPTLRSTTKLQTVAIPSKTTGVEMRLRLESDDYKTYRVILKNQNDESSIWQSGALKSSGAAKGKILNVRFPARFLKSQIYSLQVAGINADGEFEILSDYPFRVVR